MEYYFHFKNEEQESYDFLDLVIWHNEHEFLPSRKSTYNIYCQS